MAIFSFFLFYTISTRFTLAYEDSANKGQGAPHVLAFVNIIFLK